jgi:hypothetical protein
MCSISKRHRLPWNAICCELAAFANTGPPSECSCENDAGVYHLSVCHLILNYYCNPIAERLSHKNKDLREICGVHMQFRAHKVGRTWTLCENLLNRSLLLPTWRDGAVGWTGAQSTTVESASHPPHSHGREGGRRTARPIDPNRRGRRGLSWMRVQLVEHVLQIVQFLTGVAQLAL